MSGSFEKLSRRSGYPVRRARLYDLYGERHAVTESNECTLCPRRMVNGDLYTTINLLLVDAIRLRSRIWQVTEKNR